MNSLEEFQDGQDDSYDEFIEEIEEDSQDHIPMDYRTIPLYLLAEAAQNGRLEDELLIRKWMLSMPGKTIYNLALFEAARLAGNLDICDILLDDESIWYHENVLPYAAQHGNTKIVKSWLDAKKTCNFNEMFQRLLDDAEKSDNVDIISVLMTAELYSIKPAVEQLAKIATKMNIDMSASFIIQYANIHSTNLAHQFVDLLQVALAVENEAVVRALENVCLEVKPRLLDFVRQCNTKSNTLKPAITCILRSPSLCSYAFRNDKSCGHNDSALKIIQNTVRSRDQKAAFSFLCIWYHGNDTFPFPWEITIIIAKMIYASNPINVDKYLLSLK